jgi:predicted Ser/Thr protein kinase
VQPQIKDIKPLVEIPDYSFYCYIGLVATISTLLVVVIYLIIKHIKKLKKESKRKTLLKEIKNLKIDSSKEFAYRVTYLGRELAKSDRSKRVLDGLIAKLEDYKYRKSVPSLSKDIQNEYELFVEIVTHE